MKWPFNDRTQWHRWFAWYPVVIDGRWVWLEVVERQCGETFCGDYTNYRACTSTNAEAR